MTDVRPSSFDNDHEGRTRVYPPAVEDAAPGGPLDDIKSGLKAWFDVGLTIGKSIDTMNSNLHRLMNRLQHNTPVFYRRANSVVYPSSGVGVIGLGKPDKGTYWDVKQVSILGTDYNVTAAGSAGLYITAVVPPAGSAVPAGGTALVDFASVLPDSAQYGSDQIIAQDEERVIVVIFSGTPGQTYVANLLARVLPTDAAGGRVENIA
jgi:hypothetical protein